MKKLIFFILILILGCQRTDIQSFKINKTKIYWENNGIDLPQSHSAFQISINEKNRYISITSHPGIRNIVTTYHINKIVKNYYYTEFYIFKIEKNKSITAFDGNKDINTYVDIISVLDLDFNPKAEYFVEYEK